MKNNFNLKKKKKKKNTLSYYKTFGAEQDRQFEMEEPLQVKQEGSHN
jgi:hypothetical protein